MIISVKLLGSSRANICRKQLVYSYMLQLPQSVLFTLEATMY